jgi:hypothetical protein
MGRRSKRTLAVIDFETDPFKYGRVPEPFAVELWDGEEAKVFWGTDCAEQLLCYLENAKPLLIYAHNGGKFDFHFIHKGIENPALIIKGRIVKAKLGRHEIRDSFAILPIPLRNYKKKDIDYAKMESEVRDSHKEEILDYLHHDCLYLYELVSAFIERFGPRLTIGGTAIREIRKMHPFPSCGERHDKQFRPFYYGGRVQCFSGGDLHGPWKCFDVNSMYPYVMKTKHHPIGDAYDYLNTMPKSFEYPFFLDFTGTNFNALPYRNEDGQLIFNHTHGRFRICSHELEVALKHNLITIDEIHHCYVCQDYITFDTFVDTYYAEKKAAKKANNITSETFAKLLLNSGYGRCGINPANFEDWIINRDFGNYSDMEAQGYALQHEYRNFELWSRPTDINERSYCDVAIAASITSAARATLLEGLQVCDNPIYCDTDSIICTNFHGAISSTDLGSWDLEKEADYCAIAGKKLYALYNRSATGVIEPIKVSSKGGTLTAANIIHIAGGGKVYFERDAPTFSLKKPPSFVSRNFRNTVDMAQSRD